MPSLFSSFGVADRPLVLPDSDTLGRAPFAGRVAREFHVWHGDRALIVGLHGECGAGKTTLKNFIQHALARIGPADSMRALSVEFAPPPGGTDDTILRAFPEQIAAALAVKPEELRTELVRRSAPVIAWIDNVDRLSPAHVVVVMRLLEQVAEWPKFVCGVIFTKSSLLPALTAAGIPAPAAYLRKLIHLELELPEAPDALLRRQLETRLEEWFARVTFPARPRERWNDFFSAAVWPLFSTPREVQRFLAAVAFQFDGFFRPEEGVLEVNPIDLVALEVLRMFAPPVYGELRDTFRRRETRVVRLMSGREEERKEIRLEIDRGVEQLVASSRHKRAIAAALQQLVPLGTGANGGREDWDRDLRFCSQRHVERYFHLGAIADAVPAHRLIAVARATDDREKLQALLVRAANEQMLPEMLDRLPPLIQGISENQATTAAVALCAVCDELPGHAPADTEMRLIKLACELFAQVTNPLKRENIVAALLDDPARLTGPILLMQALRPRSDAMSGPSSTSLSIEQYRRLLKPAAAKLQENALSGAIWRSREAGTLIKRWWEWSAEKDEVQRWLLHQMKDPEHARAWLRAFISASTTSPAREVVLQLEELGQYCDPNVVAFAATSAHGDPVDRAAVKRLAQVLGHKGTSVGFAVRTINVPLEPEPV